MSRYPEQTDIYVFISCKSQSSLWVYNILDVIQQTSHAPVVGGSVGLSQSLLDRHISPDVAFFPSF